ncbi:MAG: NAD(P)H-hydrate epimerase [Calditrichaeota bacterium]|nr:NAD(P)H-hydrate epimerase [Calditrichota bacterium]
MISEFVTDTEILVPAITTEQMREVDRIVVEETGPNLFQMMENAGRNLALTAMEIMGDGWKDAAYLILAGTGGNGGGGICAARHLANRGLKVYLCITNPDRLGEMPAIQRKIYRAANGTEVLLSDLDKIQPTIILDAVIGYNLKQAPAGPALEMIRWANQSDALKLSLDTPSGVDSTSGETPGEFIRAAKTLTLALPKTGLLPEKTGDLILSDIGIPAKVYSKLGLEVSAELFDKRFRVPLKAKQ